MYHPKYETLEEIAHAVTEHLLPEINQSVEVCVKSYLDDPVFNDMWIFGTQLWRNAWNRFEAVASFADCPFEIGEKGNEYKLRLGKYVIRHHRIDQKTRLPNAAKAAKSAADALQQRMLFSEEWQTPFEIGNIIIAIDADINSGLKEVFVGKIMPHSYRSNQYHWEEKVPVYIAEGARLSESDIFEIEDMAALQGYTPIENTPEVSVKIDRSATEPKGAERDGKR